MFGRLFYMLRKEFIQTFRDPRMRAVIIIVPILQTLVFGYAVTTDVKNISTIVIDQNKTRESRDLINSFTSSGYFKQNEYVFDKDEAFNQMDRGKVDLIILIPEDFNRNIFIGKPAGLQILIDGSNATTAGVVLGYTRKIFLKYTEEIIRERNTEALIPTVELKNRAWFNQNLLSRNFYIPGVIAMIVMIITLMLSSMSVVRETEIGTIEQVMVTPISKGEFILGKTLPFAIIGMVDVIIVTMVAFFYFHIPFRGNLLLLLAANSLFLLSTLGVGLFISTISSTQQQAMLSTFFFIIPAMLLSGFIFPISNMPNAVQIITFLNPLRYMIVIIRGIFLKGIGLDILWPQFLALAILGISLLTFSILKFKKIQ